jgi:hypothetical protein
MKGDCFICLNDTRNKVCSTCNCFCHPKCWGKYVKEKTDVVTYIYPKKIMMKYHLYVKCPICKTQIGNVKPLTRSDTLFSRRSYITMIISNRIKDMRETDCEDNKKEIAKKLDLLLIKNRKIIPTNCMLYKLVKDYINNI